MAPKAPAHLTHRADSAAAALQRSDEAAALAVLWSNEAVRCEKRVRDSKQQHPTTTGGHLMIMDEADAKVQAQHVKESTGTRLPNCAVSFFQGLEYRGTFVGTVDAHGRPHGAGTWKETKGFAVGGGLLGSGGGNRGESGILYRGQWRHGEAHGYGQLLQGADPRRRASFLGHFAHGQKDGYGVSRYPGGALFYKGEYLCGQREGFGARWRDDGTPQPHEVGLQGAAGTAAAAAAATPLVGPEVATPAARPPRDGLGGNAAAKTGQWAHNCPVNTSLPHGAAIKARGQSESDGKSTG